MKKNLFAVAVLALAPGVAAAAGGSGALRLGVSETHVGMAGASANMPGFSLGVGGLYRGVGIHAGVSFARGAGASLEVLNVRATASPHAAVSPYMSVGLVDLASLSGATSSQTTYGINPATGVITPTTTTQALPPMSAIMGYGFVGLRARYSLQPRVIPLAHAALGAGFGGSTTGLQPAAAAASPLATSLGVGMRYRVTRRLAAGLTYTRVVVPVRGATYRSGEVAIQVSALFH